MEWSGCAVASIYQAQRPPRGPEPVSVRVSRDTLDLSGPGSRFCIPLDDECRIAPDPRRCVIYSRSDGSGYRIVLELAEDHQAFVDCCRRNGLIFLDFNERCRITHKLGQGSCASVFFAQHEGTEVAVKIAQTAEGKELLRRESRLLHGVRSPHVVEALGLYEISVKGRPCLALVLERMRGELHELVPPGGLDEAAARPLFTQLLTAVSDLHAQGIAHRDLKPANVLFREEQGAIVLKVCDLGLACGLEEPPEEWQVSCGTVGYCAPEMLAGRGAGAKCDLFSLGVLLFELLTAKQPFGVGPEALERNRRGVFPTPPPLSKDCLVLLAGLVHQSPAKRWSAAAALASAWVSGRSEGEAPVELEADACAPSVDPAHERRERTECDVSQDRFTTSVDSRCSTSVDSRAGTSPEVSCERPEGAFSEPLPRQPFSEPLPRRPVSEPLSDPFPSRCRGGARSAGGGAPDSSATQASAMWAFFSDGDGPPPAAPRRSRRGGR